MNNDSSRAIARPDISTIHTVAVLTGAGVSAESGVPTFRGEGGLWRNYRAEDLATPGAFRRDPALVWAWYNWRRGLIAPCKPNPAHETLAEMERCFADFTLITQNVDGLHVLAGSRHVLELHGNIYRLRCTRGCRAPWEDRAADLADIPPRCPGCGALARPDVVWFGESLPTDTLDAAWKAARHCQLMLVVGTSAVVHPAASLPLAALDAGAYVIEINPERTPLSARVHEAIRAAAAEALPAWWRGFSSTSASLLSGSKKS